MFSNRSFPIFFGNLDYQMILIITLLKWTWTKSTPSKSKKDSIGFILSYPFRSLYKSLLPYGYDPKLDLHLLTHIRSLRPPSGENLLSVHLRYWKLRVLNFGLGPHNLVWSHVTVPNLRVTNVVSVEIIYFLLVVYVHFRLVFPYLISRSKFDPWSFFYCLL